MKVWKTLLIVFLQLGKYHVHSLEIVPFGQPLFRLPENPNPTRDRDRTRYRHNYPINPIIRTAGNNNQFAPVLWDLASTSYPVDFFIYTKDNPYLLEVLTVNNASDSKYFDANKSTKFIIHDFMQSTENSLIHDIKDAYINKKENYNVIMVDWEPARTYTYTVAVTVSEYVGKMAARIVQAMKMDPSKVHVIGFGLGAHAAGVMGNDLKQQMNMTLARITGLDPSLPLFRMTGDYFRLDSEDAAFVDVIHTDGGDNLWNSNHLGMGKELGDVDIYPNRGIFQPGCRQTSLPDYNSLQCSHQRALEMYKESIDDEMSFVACKCPTWTDFMESKCNCMLESNRIFVGEACPTEAHRGNYYLVTNEAPPFGLGGKGTLPVLTRATDPGIAMQNFFSLSANGGLLQGIGQLTSIFTSPFKPFLNTLVRNAQQFNENFNNNNINNNNNNFNNNNQNQDFNVNQDIILNENISSSIIPPMIPMPMENEYENNNNHNNNNNDNFDPLQTQLQPPI